MSVKFKSVVFNDRCPGCGAADGPLCIECRQSFLVEACCPLCTRLSTDGQTCRWHRGSGLTSGVSLGPYTDRNRALLWAVKFGRFRATLDALGVVLADAVRQRSWPIAGVVAIPTHWRSLLRRGYGVPDVLGTICAHELGLPLFKPLRARAGRSQIGLNRQERQTNPQKRFTARPHAHIPAHILLIDDLRTTGATLVTCAKLLRAAGARRVYVATLWHED